MIKVKGVIIYPGLIDETLKGVEGVSSEYQVMIDHLNGKDIVTLFFETPLSAAAEVKALEKGVETAFKKNIGLTADAKATRMGELPRSEKKSTRIFDNRY
jgi:phenylacetate-CoA ligase